MGWFDSMVEAWFTPPGTNAANAQNERNAQVAKYGMNILDTILPGVRTGISAVLPEYISSITGGQGKADMARAWSALQRQYTNLSSMTPQSSAEQAKSAAMASLIRNPAFLSTILSSPGGRTSANLSAINAGNTAYSNAMQQAYSPEAQAQRIGGLLNLGTMVNTQSPAQQNLRNLVELLNIFNQAGSMVYGQPQVRVGSGLGDVLGQMASAWAGSGFKLPSSGGSGGGGQAT